MTTQLTGILEKEWQAYCQQVLTLASSVQVNQSRQDFYAGMTAMMHLVSALGDPLVTEEQAVARMEAMQQELLATIQGNLTKPQRVN